MSALAAKASQLFLSATVAGGAGLYVWYGGALQECCATIPSGAQCVCTIGLKCAAGIT